jgi:ubiquinone/menaquinone biosynthesis C-methylase UbiE
MSATSPAQQPDAAVIFEICNAYHRSAAMKAGVELELFTAIGEGNTTVDALAKRCGGTDRGIRILCDYLAIQGLLGKEDAQYHLSPTAAAFLDQRSPSYMGSITKFLNSELNMVRFQELGMAVKGHGHPLERDGSTADHNAAWVEFARSMAPMMALPSEMLARLLGAPRGHGWKVLDIAAGHGLYGIAFAKQQPDAQIVGVDWPEVLAVATENVATAGVSGRYRPLPGSAFDADFGDSYDVVLLPNFLHHFDKQTNERLLRKIHAALKPGGRVAALEFVPNADRVSPPMAASFSLIMLASTAGGDAYTFAEYESMFRNGGFKDVTIHAIPPSPENVLIGTK